MSNCNAYVFTFYMETNNASFPTFSKTTNNFHESVFLKGLGKIGQAGLRFLTVQSFYGVQTPSTFIYLFIFVFDQKKSKFLWKVVPDCT